jgi:alpha-galactosidase
MDFIPTFERFVGESLVIGKDDLNMDRRNFLKIAGLSFGSILISKANIASTPLSTSKTETYRLNLPDIVRITLESGEEMTVEGSKNQYEFGSIVVQVLENDKGLTFKLTAEGKSIKYVTAGWRVQIPVTAVCLGDHWERGYGDLQWKKMNGDRIMPWYFMEYNGKECNGFGVMTGCSALCYWQADPDTLQLVMDVRNGSHGVRLGSRTLEMATVVAYKGKGGERPFLALRKLCKLMCPTPRLTKQPVYGINDWYFAYGNNSDELIMKTVELTGDLAHNTNNRPYCLIDAGWAVLAPQHKDASSWSDNFYQPGRHFKDMGKLAEQIKSHGMRPGLWMRPLCAAHDTPKTQLMMHSGHVIGEGEALRDPTVPETAAYLQRCFKAYHEWGYEMVKHDYTSFDMFGKWGMDMLSQRDVTNGSWMFHNRSVTNAEVMLNLYRSLRNAAGDIPLIGCNTFSHLGAGLFEVQRIGDDTSGKEWARTLKMGVNSLAFRIAQHNQFYAADPDCVGLTTEVDWRLNKQWMELIAGSGVPLFISAQPKAVGEEQRKSIRDSFDLASKEIPVGEPLDWLETMTPSKWTLNGQKRVFEWS